MKKRLAFLTIPFAFLGLWLSLWGCGTLLPEKEITAEELVLTFDVPAQIQMGEQVYPCRISHDLTQRTQITFTETGPLEGLTYLREQGSDSLSYRAMTWDVRPAGFPKDSLPAVADVLDFAQSYVNLEAAGGNVFTGSAHGTAFTITADSGGNITELSADGLQVTFLRQTDQ